MCTPPARSSPLQPAPASSSQLQPAPASSNQPLVLCHRSLYVYSLKLSRRHGNKSTTVAQRITPGYITLPPPPLLPSLPPPAAPVLLHCWSPVGPALPPR